MRKTLTLLAILAAVATTAHAGRKDGWRIPAEPVAAQVR